MLINGEYNYLSVKIDKSMSGKLVRDILRQDLELSRRLVNSAKQKDNILLNDKPCRVRKIVYEGDVLKLMMLEKSDFTAEEGNLNVVYEDKDVIVVDKEPFMLVHPSKNVTNGTLINRLIKYALDKNEIYKPHLVNRLDRDTSGLLIVAKNPYAHYELMKDMAENKVSKKYIAITKGGFKDESGLLDFKILDKKTDENIGMINRIVSENGKEAKTLYRVLKDNGDMALVELELITGRTHQIRVHLSEIGHPLLGDSLYGDFCLNKLPRQALHAYKLKFKSPRGSFVELESKLPEDISKIISL